MDWREKAEEIVGARPAEFDPEWHEAKIRLIEGHLQRAYEEGVKVAEEGAYEIVEWEELVDGETMTHFTEDDNRSRFEVRGPLGNVMVVVPDSRVLEEGGPVVMAEKAEAILKASKRVLKDTGWDGEVILVPSDIKLMRLRRRPF